MPAPESRQFTFLPKDKTLREGMMDGLLSLPGKVSSLTAHGVHHSVTFPIYEADPSGFFSDAFDVVTVKALKDTLRDQVIDYSSPETAPSMTLPDNLMQLDTADQAKAIVAYMQEYRKRPALPEKVRAVVLDTLANPPEGMQRESQAVALVGYIGHYLGEYDEALYLDTFGSMADLEDTQYGRIMQLVTNARQVFKQQDEAVSTILAMPMTDNERIASTALAAYEMGLDSEEVHTLTHRATMSQNQPNKPETAPSVRRTVG
jgi:hypothetical protein